MSGPDTAGGGAGGRGRGPPAATPPPSHSTSGGQFLLQLLQSSSSSSPTPHHHHHHHHDPAVAAVGPAVPIPSSPPFFSPPFPHSPPAQNIWPLPGRFDPGLPRFPHGQPRPGFLPGHIRPPQPPEAKNVVLMEDGLVFGSFKCEAAGVAPTNGLLPGARVLDPPPGFGPRRIAQYQRFEGSSPSLHQVKHAGGMQSNGLGQFQRESARWAEEGGERASNGSDLPESIRFGSLGPPSGSSLRSGPSVDHGKMINGRSHENVDSEEEGGKDVGTTSERLTEILTLKDESAGKNDRRHFGGSRGKDLRSNLPRGVQIPNYLLRNRRRVMECRRDIESLTPLFLSIYESLVPSREEKVKQSHLLASLEELVIKKWPEARLQLYGSCANSFAFSNSDIDVCLSIDETGVSKTDILLKLADILKSNNLENVQPLTRARIPIVKLMDPVTGISCDICINNLLAVINTKLLLDYAQIDARLHQLAFIVKHWARCRGVNETYRGTLSSYAYVLMCIHFLQMRNPAILPCLQEMKATCVVNVDDVECAYYDKVENLHGFGSRNRESIAKLLWDFFDYWAYRHDYTNDVISVRTGSIISKREKDWTRRVGNDRHLICIEDPFEVSHDLGRVVDRYSIKDLRTEFERAAYILHYDRNPCVSLFEPYIPD